jgi:hypothetical protein
VDIEVASAATYRRKKGDFVAWMEWRTPSSEFLIARGYQGGAETGQLRPARNEGGEKLLDTRTGRKLDRFLGSACNFPEATEEENLYVDGRRNAAHGGIVTRGAAVG